MEKPIGIFDSGIGGLSVLNKLKELLPNESFVYLADNINCPYGNKSKKEIVFFSVKNTSKLIELNCKMIVVACNTATTNAIQKIRERVSVPVIGIEPGIKPAINYTKTNNIGVLATEKTLSSKLFMKTSKENKIHNIKIHEQIGYDLVNTIEKRSFSRNELFSILKSYLTPMINKNIDCLDDNSFDFGRVKTKESQALANEQFYSIVDALNYMGSRGYELSLSEFHDIEGFFELPNSLLDKYRLPRFCETKYKQ